jgi:hypothetical protein
MAGAVLMGLFFCWFSPCSGMEVLTQGELEKLSGRTGISLAFGGRFTPMRATFRSLSQGDTDGWGGKTATWAAAQDDNPGWLVLIGNGTNTGSLSFTVPDGVVMSVDVGRTGASACTPAGGAPYAGLSIPANTPFFTFSMTDAVITLGVPTTVNICLTNDAAQAVGSMEVVGRMNMDTLMIDKAVMKSECYIWAH